MAQTRDLRPTAEVDLLRPSGPSSESARFRAAACPAGEVGNAEERLTVTSAASLMRDCLQN